MELNLQNVMLSNVLHGKGAQAETFKRLEAWVRACCDRPRAVIDLAL